MDSNQAKKKIGENESVNVQFNSVCCEQIFFDTENNENIFSLYRCVQDAGEEVAVMLRETSGDPTETALLRCVEAVEGNTEVFRQMHRTVLMVPFNPMTRIQVSLGIIVTSNTNII